MTTSEPATTTKAAVLCGIQDLRVVDRPLPAPLAHQVQLSIKAVGICGSDMAYWSKGVAGGFKPLDFSEAGLCSGYCGQMGHECAGVVTQIGSSISHLQVGDRVALEPGVPCGACRICRKGRYNLCPEMRFIGSAVNETPGAMCGAFNHDARFCHKLPDHVSMEEGAMFEPLCVALHAVKRAGVEMGQKVLVTGAGPIGLLTSMAAKAAGASEVVVTDVVDSKLATAREVGADRTFRADSDGVSATLAQQFDVCFECSGVVSALDLCTSSAVSGGRICVVANLQKKTPTGLQELARREVDVVGVYRYCNLYPTALAMVAAGKIKLKPLLTKRFPLEKANEAFKYFATAAPVKVIIQPSE